MLAAAAPPSSAPGAGRPTSMASALSDGNLSDSGAAAYYRSSENLSSSTGNIRARKHVPQSQKFPHLRAQLAVIAQEYRLREAAGSPSTGNDSDGDAQDDGAEPDTRVSSMLVRQVANLLGEEKEDELKELLVKTFDMDTEATETPVLELMHAHKDDTAGVPFLFLTPTRRAVSRPSSRASNHSFRLAPGPPRPDTPQGAISAPTSPSLLGPIRRPHTPAMSPLGTGHNSSSYITASPSASPVLYHVSAMSYLASSLPASPLSSPRLLNAKAHEFRPTPRPLSAASSIPGTSSFAGRRAETPSPDLWAHGPGSLRGASKLAIASPLIPDNTLLPPGTPPRAHTPTSPLRISTRVAMDDDEEEDPFDQYAQAARAHANYSQSMGGAEFESSNSTSSMSEDGVSALWTEPYPHPSASYPDMFGEFDVGGEPVYGPAPYYPEHQQAGTLEFEGEYDPEAASVLTDGMTPFDVLSSVFGATLAPSELEEALAMNAYDFERAMQWLIERARPPQNAPNQRQGPFSYGGSGVHVIPRSQANMMRGGRGGFSNMGSNVRGGRFGNGTGRPQQGGNRVCRYFLAGECLRADCRFSHDLDRALCRFWLRGTCAKGENCEFLHHLPAESDVQGLANDMGHTSLSDNDQKIPARNDFPSLSQSHENAHGGKRGFSPYNGNGHRGFDPGRGRFMGPPKRQPVPFGGAPPSSGLAAQMAARKEAKAAVGDSVFSRPTVVAPRPSPRIRLRGPSLLPTFSGGETVNALYNSYRARTLQLGAARNACLSRAADAWRRGDGSAAKRFSREGHELNAKMGAEAADAATKLVRDRARVAESTVRNRDAAWSTDPQDRVRRGEVCGEGLGVILGIASKDAGEETAKLTAEERMEAVLDLHGLHSNEAAEVLEEFLLALEKEQFFGLAFVVLGDEKSQGVFDPGHGASRQRLVTGVREWLHNWGYPWNERDGIICVDPLTHMQ